jgi:ArsR family transcriptional regulator, arsenate/arsenite/antimonite-responsive transcriptional repressor
MSVLADPVRLQGGAARSADQGGERGGLTLRYLFDSYLTMYVERGRQGRLAPGQFERIAKALADPRRFALLEAIASSAQCPYHQLCEDFPVTKATISHHLKELVQAGLVDSERAGQFVNTRVRRDVMRAYAAELLRRVGSERSRTD